MADTWIPVESELAKVAATVPLLSSLAMVERENGGVTAQWSRAGAIAMDQTMLAALLPLAAQALGGTDHVTVTIGSPDQAVVLAELGKRWVVVFGFSEPVSYDWSSYYVRRALGLLKRKDA